MPGGQELGARNVQQLKAWFSARENWDAGRWEAYIFRGELNKSLIARECDFSRTAFRTNPALLAICDEQEAKLREAGIVSGAGSIGNRARPPVETAQRDETTGGNTLIVAKDLARLHDRLNRLEVENANLREENVYLQGEMSAQQRKMDRYVYLDRHLHETGRLLHP